MIKKRNFVLAIVFLTAVGLTACGGKEGASDKDPEVTIESSDASEDGSDTSEESGEEDAEGTPISLTTPIDFDLDTIKIHSEWIKFAEPYVVEDGFSPRIAAVGDYLIVLADDNKLGKYKNEGGSLKLENSWTLDNSYEILSQGPDNTFFLSGLGVPLIQMDLDGNKLASYDGADRASISHDGTAGLVTWYGKTPEKLTISGTTATKEPVSALEGYLTNRAVFSNDHIFICGKAPDSEDEKVYVLDKDYNILNVLGKDGDIGDDTVGSATSVIETDNHYVVLDGNLRKLMLWDKEGNFVGKIEDGDIFGTGYPWICTNTTADDGTIYIGLSEGREEDNSKDELLVFKVSGL